MIMKSQSNIWQFPQTINQYPNQASGVFDDASNEFARFGGHFQFNEGSNPFVVGVYVDNISSAYNPFGLSGLPANRQLNAFYGRNLGSNPFGAHIYTFNSNNEQEGNNGFRQGMTGVGISLGMTVGGGAWDLAFDASTKTFTNETISGTGTVTQLTEPDGNIALGLKARRWFPINSKITWVAHGMVSTDKMAWTDPNASAGVGAYETKTTEFNIGWGLNFTPTSKVLAILDVMFDYRNVTTENDTNGDGTLNTDTSNKRASFPPSYTVGMDAEVLSWLDLRMGASNYRRITSFENNITSTGKQKRTLHDNETFLGFGLHFGDLEFDAYVNPRFVIEGPYFISGDATNNIFMSGEATLHF